MSTVTIDKSKNPYSIGSGPKYDPCKIKISALCHMHALNCFCLQSDAAIYTLHKKQPSWKKGSAHVKKGNMRKVVKSKVAAQKWLWWSVNGKIFNSNNSGKSWC